MASSGTSTVAGARIGVASFMQFLTGSNFVSHAALGSGGAIGQKAAGVGGNAVGGVLNAASRISKRARGGGMASANNMMAQKGTPFGRVGNSLPAPMYWEQMLALRVFPNVLAFLWYVMSVLLTVVGVLFFLYQVMAVLGVTGRLSSTTAATGVQRAYGGTIGRLKQSLARGPYLARVGVDVMLFVPATLADFLVATFVFFGMLFACWLVFVLLVVLTWFFLNVEADPAAYVTNAAMVQADLRDTYNVFVNVGGVYVTALVAFFNAIMNVLINFAVQLLRLLLRYIGGQLLGNSLSGDVGADIQGNFQSMSTVQNNFGGRRALSSEEEEFINASSSSSTGARFRTPPPAIAMSSAWRGSGGDSDTKTTTRWVPTDAERRQLQAEASVLTWWMSSSALRLRGIDPPLTFSAMPDAAGGDNDDDDEYEKDDVRTRRRRRRRAQQAQATANACGSDAPYPVACDGQKAFSDVPDIPFMESFDVVAMVSMWIAEIINVFAQLVLILTEVVLEIFVPVIRFLVNEIASVFTDLGCAFISPGCAVLQLFNDFAVAAVIALNSVLNPIAQAVSLGAFGNQNVIPIPSFACGIEQLAQVSVPCNCNALFSALPACGATTYHCTQNTLTGVWTQYVDHGDGTQPTALASNRDQALACTHTRRMLTSRLGAYRNLEEFGGTSLEQQRACINGTLFGVATADDDAHALVYLGACAQVVVDETSNGKQRRRRRRTMTAAAVPHGRSRAWLRETLGVADVPDVLLPSSSSSSSFSERTYGGGDGTEALSRQELVRRYWSQASRTAGVSASSSSSFVAGGVRCELSREALPTTPAERHADWLCSVEMGRRTAARENPADRRTFASTGTAALRPRASGRGLTQLVIEDGWSGAPRRLTSIGLGIIQFGEALRVRSMVAADADGGSPRRRLNILTSELPSDVATRQHLWGRWANQRIVTGAVKAALDVIRHEMKHASEFELRDQRMRAERPRRRDLAGLIKRSPCASAGDDNTFLCPDGVTCVREFSLCPEPEVWTPDVAARYTALSWKEELGAGSIADVAAATLECWAGYDKDPSTYPFALENFGKNLYTETSFVWCPPLQRPSNFRLTPMVWDMATWVEEQCVDASCQCDGFADFLPTKEAFDFDPQHQWRQQLPIFVYTRIYNGLFAMQLGTAMAITNGTVFPDLFWQSLFGPLTPHVVPVWFARMWSDMGIPGTGGQQALCVTLHLGSVWFTLTLLFFCVLVFFAFWGPVTRLFRRVMSVVSLPVVIPPQGALDAPPAPPRRGSSAKFYNQRVLEWTDGMNRLANNQDAVTAMITGRPPVATTTPQPQDAKQGV